MVATALTSRVLKTQLIDWRKFKFIQPEDFKDLNPDARRRLKNSILTNKFTQPFYVWQEPDTGDIYCLDGKHRTLILEELIKEGIQVPELLPATFIHCVDIKEAAELVLIYSSIYAKTSEQGLFDFIKMYELDPDDLKMSIDIPGIDALQFEGMFLEDNLQTSSLQSLEERFIIPPFSVFDTRQGYWQERKRTWNGLFDSQATRENIDLIAKSGQSSAVYELRNKMRAVMGRDPEWDEILEEARQRKIHIYEGGSIFDPVLTEICYRWFCPEGGLVLDPFAGGSVRGIVAGLLNYHYTGIDLRKEQIEANNEQASKLTFKNGYYPDWIHGNSLNIEKLCPRIKADFLFSCPPYYDLEQYSDDPEDLSNMSYDDFLTAYRAIITKSMDHLKDNRFACFVVGDIRDKEGNYRNFVSETIDCFCKCIDANGKFVRLYNEIILINVAGSLPIRVGRMFETGRKVGKMHQNILVFYKGNPKKIREEFPEIKMVKYLQELNYQPNIASSVID